MKNKIFLTIPVITKCSDTDSPKSVKMGRKMFYSYSRLVYTGPNSYSRTVGYFTRDPISEQSESWDPTSMRRNILYIIYLHLFRDTYFK